MSPIEINMSSHDPESELSSFEKSLATKTKVAIATGALVVGATGAAFIGVSVSESGSDCEGRPEVSETFSMNQPIQEGWIVCDD
ncbi:MAG: hypothetical protein LC687_08155 [Actinobacteria bacterium]|nr:hypothetical protein [Actinomycetota bacterium]